jgi:alcohol dehydrogenase class IV
MLVCSKSTQKYFELESYIIYGVPQSDILELKGKYDNVIACGGGAVIDTAKILSKTPITCYPTTAAGSVNTSWSVYWERTNKKSIKVPMPAKIHVVEEFINDLPEKVKEYTSYDAISHCLDVMWSIYRTKESMNYVNEALKILKTNYSNKELIYAGNLAGKAIELCSTTVLHSLSYPLTGFYKIPHGKALGFLLPRVCKYMGFDLNPYIKYPKVELMGIDFQLIAKESTKYNKLYNTRKKIILEEILK